MVKFDIEIKSTNMQILATCLRDFSKIIENQTAFISISEREIRFFNVIANLNHEYHVGAALVLNVKELTSKDTVRLKDRNGQICISLNKMSEVINTMNFSQFYTEMGMKLVKDSSSKRFLRFKFHKSDSQMMVYSNDCGIEFASQKYPAEEAPEFETSFSSEYMKQILDLSNKFEDNLIFNFHLKESRFEVVLANQSICLAVSCDYTHKSESVETTPLQSFLMYHKFCKRLASVIKFDQKVKISMGRDKELCIENLVMGGPGGEDAAIGKFKFVIPVQNTKTEE